MTIETAPALHRLVQGPASHPAPTTPTGNSALPADETSDPEIVARRCPVGLDRHEGAFRRIALYEGSVRRTATTGWNRRTVGETDAWTYTFGVRLGDVPTGFRYRIEREWCRRIQPPVIGCFGRALGRPGTKPNEQALVPADPWRFVETDKALAYLKAVPHGARFRFTVHDPWYVKSETDGLSRTIVARREEDGFPVLFPPNVLVELDPSEIPG